MEENLRDIRIVCTVGDKSRTDTSKDKSFVVAILLG